MRKEPAATNAIERFSSLSRASKVVLILGALLVLAAVSGVLRVDRGIRVTDDRAVSIAQTQIDFSPEKTVVRLVRRGFGSVPYWAVSFSIPGPERDGYARLTTVLVNANTGEIAEVHAER